MAYRQKLLWMPEGIDTGAYAKQYSVPYSGPKPTKLWTLYSYTNQNSPPELPFLPVHNVNAFIEEPHHDWDIRNKTLKYYSRAVEEGGVWLLLEF